jgi:hypothetical protein
MARSALFREGILGADTRRRRRCGIDKENDRARVATSVLLLNKVGLRVVGTIFSDKGVPVLEGLSNTARISGKSERICNDEKFIATGKKVKNRLRSLYKVQQVLIAVEEVKGRTVVNRDQRRLRPAAA